MLDSLYLTLLFDCDYQIRHPCDRSDIERNEETEKKIEKKRYRDHKRYIERAKKIKKRYRNQARDAKQK